MIPSVTRSRNMRDVLKLTNEWPERLEFLTAQMPYLAALKLRTELQNRIPNASEWKEYRASLEVVEINGAGRGVSAFAVRSLPLHRRIGQVDAEKVVLYVKPRKRMRSRILPAIAVLAQYSPWTATNLPFKPSSADAHIVSRRVSKREVRAVERDRIEDKSEWGLALRKAGVREESKDPKKELGGLKTVPDFLFEALRLEFGLGGTKAVPAWRKSISLFDRNGMRRLSEDEVTIARALTDVSWRGWKIDGRSVPKVAASHARSYARFQQMLGVRS